MKSLYKHALYKDMLFSDLASPWNHQYPVTIALYHSFIDYPVLISIASLRKRIQVFKNNNHIKFSHETSSRSHNYPPQHDIPHFKINQHFHYQNHTTSRSRRDSENSKTRFCGLSRYEPIYEVIFHMKQNQDLMRAGLKIRHKFPQGNFSIFRLQEQQEKHRSKHVNFHVKLTPVLALVG